MARRETRRHQRGHQADTDLVFALYRTQLFGPDDLDNVTASSCHPPVSLVFIATDKPVTDPRKCSNAGPKSLLDKPGKYSSGNTSATCGDLPAHRW
jgi:hypothetical protein